MFARFCFVFACLVMSATASAQTDIKALVESGRAHMPDYGVAHVIAEPGHTVLRVWGQTHRYFENALGWNKNDFCDAFRAVNPEFTSLFTSEAGCNNPGFTKLPMGVVWKFPSPMIEFSNIAPDENETFIAAHTENYVGLIAVEKDTAVAYLTDELQTLVGSERLVQVTSVFEEAEAAAVKAREAMSIPVPTPVVVDVRQTEFGLLAERTIKRLWNSVYGLITLGTLLALIGGYLFARTRFLARVVRTHNEGRIMALKDHDLMKKALKAQNERFAALQAQENKFADLQAQYKVALENIIPFPLPDDMTRPDGARTLYLPVLDWRGEVGKSDARVFLEGTPQGITCEYEPTTGTWKMGSVLRHLNGRSDASVRSRIRLDIEGREREVVPVDFRKDGGDGLRPSKDIF